MPFTQTRLYTPDEVAAEAKRRRLRVDVGQLEALHRARLLVPFFEVSRTGGDSIEAIDFRDSRTPEVATNVYISELYRAAQDGRARDPRSIPFVAWPVRQTRSMWPRQSRSYLYSSHQLLALRWLRPVLERMRLDGSSRKWSLPRVAAATAPDVAIADSWRGVAVTLAAIDARYWPALERVVHFDAQAWREYNLAFDPTEALRWIGLDRVGVAAAADQLRHLGAGIDPLGVFYDIVRRAEPEAWSTLSGDALIAMDYRMAAEVLDAFADDLGRPPPSETQLESTPMSTQRLTTRPRSIDAALTDLGLSPHPSLVVGVEGATEALILPRVFDQLGIPSDDNWIRIVDFGGADKDLANLAKYAASPLLGAARTDYVELDSPVTRFLVLVDAEGKYRDQVRRSRQRRILLDAIVGRLPLDFQGDLYRRDARIVEVRSWGNFPFEFAHFTDLQLAKALEAAAATPHPAGREGLLTALKMQRGRPAPNVEKLWREHNWPGSGLSKTRLAEACWPILEAKIESAIASGSSGPPIMRAAVCAWDLASMPHRRKMALQRHTRRSRRPGRGRP